MDGELKITLKKSTIGSLPKHKRIIQALGLKKINSSTIKKDNPATQGMINKVPHLIKVQKIDKPEEVNDLG